METGYILRILVALSPKEMEPPNYVFSIFACIGFILSFIPFAWHFKSRNTGICLYMAWTGLGCLNSFINSIVWNKDVVNRSPVWCDISSRFMIGLSVAIPAASLCINRRLYFIATQLAVTKPKAEKRREVLVDLAIGVGIPVLQMALQYIVQGHRFNIYEEIGCYPMTYNTPASFPLVFCWPVIIGLVSAVYCSMTIWSMMKRRLDVGQLFPEDFNSSHYMRLMALASCELLLGIPWSVYACLYLNIAASNIHPYKSWDNVHASFSAIGQFPSFEWKQNHTTVVSIELTRWATIVCAFEFFGLFGFAREARKHYRIAINSIAKRVGYSTFVISGSANSSVPNHSMTKSGPGIMPIFISREAVTKRDSFASFSTDLSLGDVGDTLDPVKEPHSPTRWFVEIEVDVENAFPLDPSTAHG